MLPNLYAINVISNIVVSTTRRDVLRKTFTNNVFYVTSVTVAMSLLPEFPCPSP